MKLKVLIGIIVTLALMGGCRKRGDLPEKSALRGISYIYTIPGSSVKADIDQNSHVNFYIEIQGEREKVVSVDDAYSDGSVRGVKIGEKHWRIQWMGVTIGERRGDDTEICGPKFGYASICDATFIQRSPNAKNSKNLLILGLLDKGLEQMPVTGNVRPKSDGLNLTTTTNNTFIDIGNFATTEINQNGTGTCLYNSTTGIIEWYRNRASGKLERLSAPYVLAKLFENSFTGEVGAVNATTTMKKAAPDPLLPTQETYNQFTAFQSVYDYAKQRSQNISTGQVLSIPSLKGTKLFMLSQPSMGDFGAQGASQDQMNAVRNWLLTKKTPVHFFHYYYDTGIWHAVMALGWDDRRQLIKIKDSLSQSGMNGQWKSIASYQAMAYGAVGTESTDSSTNNNQDTASNNQSSTTSSDLDINQSTTSSTSTGPTTPTRPSTTTPAISELLAELNWLAVIQGSMMYVYVSKDVSDVSIRVAGNKWLAMPNSYAAQPGIPTIRGIFINRPTWDSQSSVDVRVIYKGQYVAAKVPIEFR